MWYVLLARRHISGTALFDVSKVGRRWDFAFTHTELFLTTSPCQREEEEEKKRRSISILGGKQFKNTCLVIAPNKVATAILIKKTSFLHK